MNYPYIATPRDYNDYLIQFNRPHEGTVVEVLKPTSPFKVGETFCHLTDWAFARVDLS